MTDTVNTILDEVNSLVASFQKQREELVEQLKPSFQGIFMPFLNKYTEIKDFWFTAYTPYFNDGEECTFSVHDLYMTPTEFDEGEDEDDYRYEGLSTSAGYYYTLFDVVSWKTRGEVDKTGEAWKSFSSQKEYQSWDHAARGYIMKKGEQDFDTWFRNKASQHIEMSVEELTHLAERDVDYQQLAKLFHNIPDDIIRDLFGDHIRVTISRNGVGVDEYSHD